MRILDLFSWLPAKEISIEEIEKIFMDDMKGIPNSTYSVSYEIPNDANANVSNCVKELLAEEKNVACLKKENVIIAVTGYKYNTASKEEKAKYNEKKLCRTMGIGMSIIAILLLIMELLESILPAFFIYVSLGIILVDVVVIIVLGNTICKK